MRHLPAQAPWLDARTTAAIRHTQRKKLAALHDAGTLRPLLDRTLPFDDTLEAMAHAEHRRAKGHEGSGPKRGYDPPMTGSTKP